MRRGFSATVAWCTMLGAGTLLVACGSTGPAAATTTPQPTTSASASPSATAPPPAPTLPATPLVGTGAADPLTALKDIVGVNGQQFCGHGVYTVAPCPVTQRFGDRLDSFPFSGVTSGASAICRCQNEPQQTFTLVSQSATWAYASLDIGAGAPVLRFTVVLVNGTWYVDDQDLGCSTTSIYNPAYDKITSDSTTPQPSQPTSC